MSLWSEPTTAQLEGVTTRDTPCATTEMAHTVSGQVRVASSARPTSAQDRRLPLVGSIDSAPAGSRHEADGGATFPTFRVGRRHETATRPVPTLGPSSEPVLARIEIPPPAAPSRRARHSPRSEWRLTPAAVGDVSGDQAVPSRGSGWLLATPRCEPAATQVPMVGVEAVPLTPPTCRHTDAMRAGADTWEPLLLVSARGTWLGAGKSDWMLGSEHGPARIAGDDPHAMLPLLEQEWPVVRARLAEVEARHPELGIVPTRPAVRLALSISTPHWPVRALRWLALGYPVDGLRPGMEALVDAAWLSPPARQVLVGLLAQRSSNAGGTARGHDDRERPRTGQRNPSR